MSTPSPASTSSCPPDPSSTRLSQWLRSKEGFTTTTAVLAIIIGIACRLLHLPETEHLVLTVSLIICGVLLVPELLLNVLRGEFSSDILAGVSIVTAMILNEYWAALLVVFMLSGGQSLERWAMANASAVLKALAQRMPHRARRRIDGRTEEISLDDVHIDDIIEVHPHDICPVDGVVLEGRSSMDEAFLTGEPYLMPKIAGSAVISGSVNGEGLLTIRAQALPRDSRYQRIAAVIEQQATRRVRIRRIADSLAAWYTPFGIVVAVLAWIVSGDPNRFLAVLVVATPCPLIIGIPICIIGAISSAARRGIIIRDPSSLETAATCSAMILDKTGTLTYGKPTVTEVEYHGGWKEGPLFSLLLSVEQYSKHPLALAIVSYAQAKGLSFQDASEVSEHPGKGLVGKVGSHVIEVGGRAFFLEAGGVPTKPPEGPECAVIVDGKPAALITFRDVPRKESRPFVEHLARHHGISTVMLLSGDRDAEAQHLATLVGITAARGGLAPEEKLSILQDVLKTQGVIFVGDGINDAPSLQAATVGIGLGTHSDILAESSDVVILDPSLERVDAFLHLSRRVRTIALQTGIGGIALSIIGMGMAACGFLPPVLGACVQEAIDLAAIFNALRAASSRMTEGDSL